MTTLTLDELSRQMRRQIEREPTSVVAVSCEQHPARPGFNRVRSEPVPVQTEWWRRSGGPTCRR